MRRASLLLSALVVLGCSSDTDPQPLTPTDANIVGSYALTSSNGRTLPLTILVTADEAWDMTSDQFVIAADKTWIETTNYKITTLATGAQRTSATQASGTYAIAN